MDEPIAGLDEPELAPAHVREEHSGEPLDEEQIRVAIAGSPRAAGGAG